MAIRGNGWSITIMPTYGEFISITTYREVKSRAKKGLTLLRLSFLSRHIYAFNIQTDSKRWQSKIGSRPSHPQYRPIGPPQMSMRLIGDR